MSSSEWDDFWKNQKQAFNAVMRIGTTFFGSKLTKAFAINEEHHILDYGCGPGFLVDFLRSKNVRVTGADINDFFLNQCKTNHPTASFIEIDSNIDVNRQAFEQHLKEEKFDFIILLSITQYFKNLKELEQVIKLLLEYTAIDGKIILADVVDPKTSPLKDALSLFYHCFREHKLKSYFAFIFYLIFSNYRKLSRNVKLLTISEQDVRTIADANLLNVELLSELTIHTTRTNYVLKKKYLAC